MQAFIAGNWTSSAQLREVRSPFDGRVIDTVPLATPDQLEAALAAAVEGARQMRQLTGYQRFQILQRTAQLVIENRAALAQTISMEEGKTLREAGLEVDRAAETLQLSAEEAKRLEGEVLPIDGASNGGARIGFTKRIPCGVVVAIAPFNFPLNLVCHKVGPALAGGNSLILKPASDTPLSALRLVELLLAAGLPPLAISCVTGSGSEIGKALCVDPRVRKITFTGSREIGEQICQLAGIKRVTMELGSNSPLLVMEDANPERAAQVIAATGFSNAGQVCVSTQRVIALPKVYDDLLGTLPSAIEKIVVGDPLDAATTMGPMIRAQDADRVGTWIAEARSQGARVLCGGDHQGALHQPTVVTEVEPHMRLSRDEVFGPAVAVLRAESLDAAIALANDSRYGLAAGILTENLAAALRFIAEVDCGNLHINWGPQWRADLMPYGGLKDSGLGREGPRYAVEAMTETKTILFHP